VEVGKIADVLVLRGGDTPRLELTRPVRPNTVAGPTGSRLGKTRPDLPNLTEAWMNVQSGSQPPSSLHSGSYIMLSSRSQVKRPGTAAVPPSKFLSGRSSIASGVTPRGATPRRLEPVAAVSAVDPAMLPAAGTRTHKQNSHMRLFPHAPNQQSIIDSVVFGRDIDQSGEEQFDEEFIVMFNGCAGKPSWEAVDFHERPTVQDRTDAAAASTNLMHRARGKHKLAGVPASQSAVDKVVFGRETVEDEFHKEFWDAYDRDVAGRPSWKQETRALRQLPTPPGKRPHRDRPTRRRGQKPKPWAGSLTKWKQQASAMLPQLPETPGQSAEA